MSRLSPNERYIRRLLVAVLTVGVTLSLSAAVAQAKLVSYGNFGSGQLSTSAGVAVDKSSHDLYVSNVLVPSLGNGNLYKFNDSGTVISPPSPFASGFYAGVAVNPTNGDVDVLDFIIGAVETYDPSSGAQVSSCPISGAGGAEIASDAAGDVYVPIPSSNEVQELTPACTPVQTFTGSGASALSGPTGVAIDPSGNLWVADGGNNRIEEFGPAGAPTGTSIASAGVTAVAVDSTGDVFATVYNGADSCGSLGSPCYHLVEYSSGGAVLNDVGAGSIGGLNPSFVPDSVTVDDASGKVYVADATNNVVWVFGPPTAPTIERELAVQVTGSSATLGVRLRPGGLETSYHFDYGTTTAYGQTVPVPDGDAGSGVQPTTGWATATGLAPSTTYHYRVVATSALAPNGVDGPDQIFTTTAGACPNDQFRSGFSASLPDCRAYEMVTPANKDSGGPGIIQPPPADFAGFEASSDGTRVAYFSRDSFPGSVAGSGSYLATRGASGWSSENLIPPQSGEFGDRCASRVGMQLYSSDLSMGILADGQLQVGNPNNPQTDGNGGCGTDDPNLVAGEPQEVQNLFLRDNTNGSYQLVDLTPAGVTPADAVLLAGSSDLSHIVFDEQAQLTAGAPGGAEDLYEWTGGAVRLVSYVPTAPATQCGSGGPACTPVAGVFAGTQINHAVSSDGSAIFFTAGSNLYARLNGSRTVQVDASQAGGSGGGGTFHVASTDGTQVLFADDAAAGLTSDTVAGSGANLYSYDTVTSQLTDLTPQPTVNAVNVLGASDDGSYVYFTATGALTNTPNSEGQTAQSGQQNLYLHHDGTTTFIATASTIGPARASTGGLFLAFTSTNSLTGYDNAVSGGGDCPGELNQTTFGPRCPEIYLYDAAARQLSCASCNPAGDSPVGGAQILGVQTDGTVSFANTYPVAYDPNSVSDSGHVFFDTPDALLPADTNGKEDVYEYRAGQLYLISPGTSQDNAWFVNATPGGSDVFFVTSQQLVSEDVDTSTDLYDARVDDGFAAPPSPAAPCVADACRPATGAAETPPPAVSLTFFGPGDATSVGAPAGKARVITRVVDGAAFLVKVSVPGPGQITIAGNSSRAARRAVPHAGTYAIRVTLNPSARRALGRTHRLSLMLRVGYEPPGAGAQTASVRLTVMQALGHGARRARRAAIRKQGGAR